MIRFIFCLLFFVSHSLEAEMICEKELSMDVARKKVNEFSKKYSMPLPEKYSANLLKSSLTCHYTYALTPDSGGGNIVVLDRVIAFYLNPAGDVVYVSNRSYIDKITCPKEKFDEEYFRKELKILRQKNPGLPKEPDHYDVYMRTSVNCTYVYLEHSAGKGITIVPYAKRINTFHFDYLGGLYSYQKDTFKIDELGK
jgi:hypothetical protein